MPFKNLLETVYPPICELCGDPYFEGETPYLCSGCFQDVLQPIEPPYCEYCGQNYIGEVSDGSRCGNCGDRHITFDFAIGAYLAEGVPLDWMHRFKYAGEIHFARMFGKLMAKVWEDSRLNYEDEWIVIPVPLHRKRLRERGFNQSLEIARQWVRHAPSDKNLKIIQALKRSRYTTRQATLTRNERLSNLRSAFSISRKIAPDQNLLIVDDVLTTGTTSEECAAVLAEALSPNKIAVISVLRG